MLFESGWDIKHRVLHTAVQPTPLRTITIPKDEFALQGLERLNEVTDRSKGISPSALNTYVQCSLRFYFRYIARIKELVAHGKTLVVVSHDLDLVQGICERGVVMEKGRKVFDGPCREAVTFLRARNA